MNKMIIVLAVIFVGVFNIFADSQRDVKPLHRVEWDGSIISSDIMKI